MSPDFHVVILSARSSNLKVCVKSLADQEGVARDRIIVVDDGARAEWPEAPVTWLPGIKPFVFSRNANIGIRAAQGNVILMNDDAELETWGGMKRLSELMNQRRDIGLCSAAVRGYVGNPNQHPGNGTGFRSERERTVAFVCVYIPRATFLKVGSLDERFTGYGAEDSDYCRRVREAGLIIGTFDGCVVHHGRLPSTYRLNKGMYWLKRRNRRIYKEKLAEERGTSEDNRKG